MVWVKPSARKTPAPATPAELEAARKAAALQEATEKAAREAALSAATCLSGKVWMQDAERVWVVATVVSTQLELGMHTVTKDLDFSSKGEFDKQAFVGAYLALVIAESIRMGMTSSYISPLYTTLSIGPLYPPLSFLSTKNIQHITNFSLFSPSFPQKQLLISPSFTPNHTPPT
jgi:hypothetical protein